MPPTEALPLGELNWSPPDQLERLTPLGSENKQSAVATRLQEMEDRMREMEEQHLVEKAEWKLKLEVNLAQAKSEKEEIAKHVEQFSDDQSELIQKLAQSSHAHADLLKQVEQLSEEKLELAKQVSQVTALHNKTVHANKHEKLRLEAQVQKSSAEWGLSMIKIQREHKNETSHLTKKVKSLEDKLIEKDTEFKKFLEKALKPWKTEKEELQRRIAAQRTQITSLKKTEKLVKDHLESELEAAHQKFTEASRTLTSSRLIKDKEISSLKHQLQAARENEAKLPGLKQEIADLSKDLIDANQREYTLRETVKSHINHRKEMEVLMGEKDEELDSWKATSEKMGKFVDDLMNIEVESADSFQEKMDSILNNLRAQLQESLNARKEMETSLKTVKDELREMTAKASDAEFQLENANVIVSDRAKMISELCARAKEQDLVIEKQREDISDWKEAATKLEQCVDDLMKLEHTTTASYQQQISTMKKQNEVLSDQVQTLRSKNVSLSSELAGLRLDDELGLETEYAFGFGEGDEAGSDAVVTDAKIALSSLNEREGDSTTPTAPELKKHLSTVTEVTEEELSKSSSLEHQTSEGEPEKDDMVLLRRTPTETKVAPKSFLPVPDESQAPLWGRSPRNNMSEESIETADETEASEGEPQDLMVAL